MARKRTGPAKLSDGFLLTAWDFHRAVRIGRFLATERLLLDEAHEVAWAPGLIDGSRQARAFRLNFSGLARVSGYDRKTLGRAHSRLEMYRVFAPEGDGSFRLDKDYARWLDADGQPRFTPEQLAWIGDGGPWSACIEVGREDAPHRHNRQVRPGAPLSQGGGTMAPQSPTTPPLPQPVAPSPLDGDGAGSACARANSDLRREKKTPPEPPQGGGIPRSSRGSRRRGRGMDWAALEEALREDDGDGPPEA